MPFSASLASSTTFKRKHAHKLSNKAHACLHARRRSTVSMELYDATPREFSVLDYLFNPNSTRPVSSYSDTPLEVLSQAFYPRLPITGLSTTRTALGITSRHLLLMTKGGQVWA